MSVKLKEVDAPGAMLNSPRTLLRFGGVATYKVTDEVFPVPPFVEVTCTEFG